MTRQFSAGGAVFKRSLRSSPKAVGLKKEKGQIYWLIIKPRPSPDFPKERSQLPKGLIDEGESSERAAVREVKEETGIETKIVTKIDVTKYIFSFRGEKIFKVVTYYLMEYIGGTPTSDHKEIQEVHWLPFEKAKKLLTYSGDKAILQKASELLKSQADTLF